LVDGRFVSLRCEAVREFIGHYEANHKAWVKTFSIGFVAGFSGGF